MKNGLIALLLSLLSMPSMMVVQAETATSVAGRLQGNAAASPVQMATPTGEPESSSEVIQWTPARPEQAPPQRHGLQKVWHTVFDKHPAPLERPTYSPSSGSMMLNFTQGSSSAEYGY